jgi:hypothetical protein
MQTECETISKNKETSKDNVSKNEIEITGLKYFNESTEFIMSVKIDQGGILEDMFRMFINYFALVKLEHKDVPEWIELRLKDLRPMALAISNELVEQYNPSLEKKLTSEEYLDYWIEQSFQFLQSHFDKLG